MHSTSPTEIDLILRRRRTRTPDFHPKYATSLTHRLVHIFFQARRFGHPLRSTARFHHICGYFTRTGARCSILRHRTHQYCGTNAEYIAWHLQHTDEGPNRGGFSTRSAAGCPKTRPQQQRRDHKGRCLSQGASPPLGQPGSTQFGSRRARAQIHPKHAAITCTAVRHWTSTPSPRTPIGRRRARPPEFDLRKGLPNAPAAFSLC